MGVAGKEVRRRILVQHFFQGTVFVVGIITVILGIALPVLPRQRTRNRVIQRLMNHHEDRLSSFSGFLHLALEPVELLLRDEHVVAVVVPAVHFRAQEDEIGAVFLEGIIHIVDGIHAGILLGAFDKTVLPVRTSSVVVTDGDIHRDIGQDLLFIAIQGLVLRFQTVICLIADGQDKLRLRGQALDIFQRLLIIFLRIGVRHAQLHVADYIEHINGLFLRPFRLGFQRHKAAAGKQKNGTHQNRCQNSAKSSPH